MESSADADTYVPMNNNHGNQPDVPDFYQEMKSQDRIKKYKKYVDKYIYIVLRSDRIDKNNFRKYCKRFILSDKNYQDIVFQTKSNDPYCKFECFQIIKGDCITYLSNIAYEMYRSNCYSDSKVYKPYSLYLALQDMQAIRFALKNLDAGYIAYVGTHQHFHEERNMPTDFLNPPDQYSCPKPIRKDPQRQYHRSYGNM